MNIPHKVYMGLEVEALYGASKMIWSTIFYNGQTPKVYNAMEHHFRPYSRAFGGHPTPFQSLCI